MASMSQTTMSDNPSPTTPAEPSDRPLRPAPFDREGVFYRGNLHCHGTPDGGIPPHEVVDAYKRIGFDFVCLSEHFEADYGWELRDTSPWREESFTTLIGAELSSPGPVERGKYWLGAVGLPLDFAPRTEGETGPQLARRARAAGAFVFLLHPGLNATSIADVEDLDAIHAVEVYNDGVHRGWDRGDGWYLAVEMLKQRRELFAVASDDAHFRGGGLDAVGGAWVMVRSPSLDPASLLDALKSGAFYSSTGPEIHDIVVDGREVEVHCSPAEVVSMNGLGCISRSVSHHRWDGSQLEVGESAEFSTVVSTTAQGITCARFSLDMPSEFPFSDWGAWSSGDWWRVTVMDADGRRAWSNPSSLGL
jgi:hypothetical protein